MKPLLASLVRILALVALGLLLAWIGVEVGWW
jgi:hypothetical protein